MYLSYLAMTFTFFFSLVRSLVKFEPLQKHCFFLSLLYTGAVAFLSYVFILTSYQVIYWDAWGKQLALVLVGTWIYFRLLVKFDEGFLFWLLVILGVPLWWFISR